MSTLPEIESAVKTLLFKYNADHALLFGSYARGDSNEESDVDILIYGGADFKKTNIFAFAEDLRQILGKDVDAFEICEVDKESPFYANILKEGVRIA